MELLRRIERHLRRNGMAPTRLGREALSDPRFVIDLRRGRVPRQETVDRVIAWLDREESWAKRSRWRRR